MSVEYCTRKGRTLSRIVEVFEEGKLPMIREGLIISAIVCTQVMLAGCGAGPSPQPNTQATAKRPTQQQATTKTAPSEKSPEQQPAADRQVDSEAEAEPESSNDPFRLVRTPKDIVTAGDTSFVFNFNASEVGSKADARCQARAAGDMQKKAACLSRRRDQFGTKILRFVNKGSDEREDWWYVTYDRRGSQLVALHKLKFEFGEQTDKTINILPQGKDKGLAPMSPVPRKVVISVPNEYSIELVDPVHGTLVYEAKIGIIGT